MMFLHDPGSEVIQKIESKIFVMEPKVPSFYTKDYVGTGTSISS